MYKNEFIYYRKKICLGVFNSNIWFMKWIFALRIFSVLKNNYEIFWILTCPDPPISCTVKRPRFDTSLCFLTQRVCMILQDSCSRVIDLNALSKTLKVPKRRLYDVTNVLEGISLARKKSKNQFEWLWVWVVCFLTSFIDLFFIYRPSLKSNPKFALEMCSFVFWHLCTEGVRVTSCLMRWTFSFRQKGNWTSWLTPVQGSFIRCLRTHTPKDILWPILQEKLKTKQFGNLFRLLNRLCCLLSGYSSCVQFVLILLQ